AEPPVIVAFSAVPAEIFAGGCSVLSWNTANATSVTIDNGVGSKPASGSTTVCPGSTTTYTLTATGDGGSVTRSVMVTVTRGWGRRRAAGHRG
ncbi:MAG TPA: hypothetical protein VNL91_11545, partial [Thermoanaerobaculia bacterium]|nr:hypothetical protein [Thermoanaerobaculia bacterium]